jgi:Zn-dependent protease with chaperone function
VAKTPPIAGNRAEPVLAFLVAAMIGFSILAFVTIVVATLSGVSDFGAGVWPFIAAFPLIGLPLGLILIIALLIINAVRRGRESKDVAQ